MAEEVVKLSVSEVQALNRLPEEPFNDFMKLVYDFLLNPKDSSKLLSDLDTFCQSIGASATAVKNLVKSLLSQLKDALKKNHSSGILQDQLERLGLAGDKTQVVCELWKQHYNSLSRSISTQVFNINQLVDMDWKFAVTAATSDESQVGHSFLQLKLVLDKGNEHYENVCLELTLPQFYSFLHEMEKAKSSLELLS